jgi:NAD+ synthase (glutamine-hydrolysing)
VGDVDANAQSVLDWSRTAAQAGAHLVVFPEMTLTGYPIEDLALRASFRRGAEAALQRTATALADEGLGDLAVLVGTVGEKLVTPRHEPGEPEGPRRPTNQAVLLQHGAVQVRYDKHHLPNYGVFDEYRIFAAGDDVCVIDVAGRRVGVVICEDIWQDGGPVSQMDENEVSLLVVLNASPYEEGKGYQRVELAARRAHEVQAPVAYVNLVGAQDDLVFDGGSFVIATDGTVLARAPQFVENLLVWDLLGDDDAPARGTVAPPLSPDEEVYRALVTGLRGYVTKNGFRSVVFGMSGGIDSALVAAIAADAIGGENVVGVSMPSVYSSEHSKDDAADLAKRIGADYRVQPIAPMVDAFESELPLDGLAAENLQARVRGVILMALSNAEGHLVLAPGNKTELAVGY